MLSPENKKGCVIFIVVILVLGAGAGVSVVIKGKSMKPKARTLISTRLDKTYEKIKTEFAADVSESDRLKFEAAYKKITEAMQSPTRDSKINFTDISNGLDRIRDDKIITVQEAAEWVNIVDGEFESAKSR